MVLDDDDLTQFLAVMHCTVRSAYLTAEEDRKRAGDHRSLPRKTRRNFRHNEALSCIRRDYLATNGDTTTPLFVADFKLMFRVSRGRFQVLMEDVMRSNYSFYKSSHMDGFQRSSIEARLLLPLKTLAYGVPHHTFIDYFQMSDPYARDCCLHFCKVIKLIYSSEYLRCPTQQDMKMITKLHKAVHHTDGLFGSLDCTHTLWKNCPKAWHGSYKGKEDKPSIVLEAVADYHLFFWHASFGYTGTLNDISILSLSPLLDRMLDGSFHTVEAESGAIPYDVNGMQFTKLFLLVDGIYPSYSRFVRGIKQPITQKQKTTQLGKRHAEKMSNVRLVF